MKQAERYITTVQLPYSLSKKTHRFVLNHYNPNPDLYEVNSNSDKRPTGNNVAYFPNSFSFLCEDNIYDASTQSMRIIRYVRGEVSIFADEQSNTEYTKTERIEFSGKHYGILNVPRENRQLLQFLAMTDYNGSKENRDTTKRAMFRYIDEAAVYETHLDQEITTDKAKSLALNCSYDEMMMLAMGIEPAIKTDGREEKAIRWDLLQRAKADPEGFMQIMDNPDTAKKAKLKDAENLGIIKRVNNGMAWASGQTFLVVPTGQNPYNFFCMQKGVEIEHIYNSICSLLDTKKGRKNSIVMTERTQVEDIVNEKGAEILAKSGTSGLVAKITHSEEVQNIFAEALKKGIFEKSPNSKMLTKWETYDHKYASKKTWLDRLSADTELLEKLQVEVASK